MGEGNGICKEHSGVCHDVTELKETEKEQWEAISARATNKFVMILAGIFGTLSLLVVAFLWDVQVRAEKRLVAFQEKLIEPETGLLIKMNKKLDDHLASWPGPPRNHNMPHEYDKQEISPNPRTGR